MKPKYRAKHRTRLAVASALAAWLMPLAATADYGNLSNQLRIQQNKSRFQLMLEQVQEQARQRAAAGHRAISTPAESTPAGLGDWSQSLRLDPVIVTDPGSPQIDTQSTRRLQAAQMYERDQQRILEQRQQRRALTSGARTNGAVGVNSFPGKRRELARFGTQNQKQALQRKLRR